MPKTALSELIPVLQVAVGPVILISGVGLLLLSLTNRFARAIDRSRQLLQEVRAAGHDDRRHLNYQIDIIYRRARLIQMAIIFGAMSALGAAVLVLTLFLSALLGQESAVLLSTLFVVCLLLLIGCLVTFIVEIHLSLRAVRLEMGHEKSGSAV